MLHAGTSSPNLMNRMVKFQKAVMRSDIYKSAQSVNTMYAKSTQDSRDTSIGFITCGRTVCGSQDTAKSR